MRLKFPSPDVALHFKRLSLLQRPVVALLIAGACFPPLAQESVNTALAACVKQEQIQLTAKGAAIGAFAGLLKSMAGDNSKKNDTGKNVLVGAAVGGVAGFVTAYFRAVGNCYKKNPSWVPESKIQNSSEFAQAKATYNYDPSMGIVARSVGVDMPAEAKPGTTLPISGRFIALTPDGAETEVIFERKLFATIDGKELEVPFPAAATEHRRVEAGESRDGQSIPIPPDIPLGSAIRYELKVSAAGKPMPGVSGSTVIR